MNCLLYSLGNKSENPVNFSHCKLLDFLKQKIISHLAIVGNIHLTYLFTLVYTNAAMFT